VRNGTRLVLPSRKEHIMRTRTLALSAAAVLAAGAVAPAAHGDRRPAEDRGSGFTLVSVPGEEYVLVDTGEPGDSVGDHSAFTDTLRTRSGRDVGYSAATCTITSITANQSLCDATLVLEQGTLSVTGIVGDGPFVAAVIGGTGIWTGASGTMAAESQPDGSLKLEFALGRR
jgi:hypothetical protein